MTWLIIIISLSRLPREWCYYWPAAFTTKRYINSRDLSLRCVSNRVSMSQKDKKDPGPTLENPYVNRNLFREARERPEPFLRLSTLYSLLSANASCCLYCTCNRKWSNFRQNKSLEERITLSRRKLPTELGN